MTNVPHHIETSQLIRIANQLINHCKTGFYIWGKHCSLMGLRILSNIYVRAFIRKLLTPFSGKRQNMLTLFHLLPQLALTISETEVNYYGQYLLLITFALLLLLVNLKDTLVSCIGFLNSLFVPRFPSNILKSGNYFCHQLIIFVIYT